MSGRGAGVDLTALLETARTFVRDDVVPLESSMIGAPWATVVPNGLSFAERSVSTWIH